MKPEFSIIIPFKEGKGYLFECIQSVLAQKYEQFEIIVLADICSNNDGAIDEINALMNPKIRIEISDKNLNILENWDRIKKIKRVEFMTILGYDDILYPDFLSNMANLILIEPGASLYHTHFNYINATGEIIKPCLPLPAHLSSEQYLAFCLQDKVSVMATGYVFRSMDYDAVNGIPIHYPNLIYADLYLWIELTKISYLSVLPSYHFSFRIHNSTTKTSKDKILLNAFVLFMKYLGKLKAENSKFEKIIQELAPVFVNNTTRSLVHRILRTEKKYRDGLSIQLIYSEIGKEAALLGIDYQPHLIPTLKTASWIDANSPILSLFQFFKRIYKKPIY
jgi:glycosyltransferase involved in cell wall biosynthesis